MDEYTRAFQALAHAGVRYLLVGVAGVNFYVGGRPMTDRPYNYDTFRRAMVEEDMGFSGGPRPGEPAPEIDLPAAGGGRFRLSDHRGVRPVLFQFGSAT